MGTDSTFLEKELLDVVSEATKAANFYLTAKETAERASEMKKTADKAAKLFDTDFVRKYESILFEHMTVGKQDVIETFRLLQVAMQQSATDHSTGTIGMDLITTGVFASERMRRENLVSTTRNIITEKMQLGGQSTGLLELLGELKKDNPSAEIQLSDLRNALVTLSSEQFVVIHGDSVKRV